MNVSKLLSTAIFTGFIVLGACSATDHTSDANTAQAKAELKPRSKVLFTNDWVFHLGDIAGAQAPGFLIQIGAF